MKASASGRQDGPGVIDFALFEGPSNHAGLDQAIKQEADLKTRDKLPMIAMTSLEACFPSFAAGRAHFDTPETGDQPKKVVLLRAQRRQGPSKGAFYHCCSGDPTPTMLGYVSLPSTRINIRPATYDALSHDLRFMIIILGSYC